MYFYYRFEYYYALVFSLITLELDFSLFIQRQLPRFEFPGHTMSTWHLKCVITFRSTLEYQDLASSSKKKIPEGITLESVSYTLVLIGTAHRYLDQIIIQGDTVEWIP